MVEQAHDRPRAGAVAGRGLDVDDVDAGGVLLERAEAADAGAERVEEDRAVDAAVRDDQQVPPARRGAEGMEDRHDAVDERAEGLAAEEARLAVERDAEGPGEDRLQLVLRDRAEPPALDLAQFGPDLRLQRAAADHDPRRLVRPGQVADHRAVEGDGRERPRRHRGLLAPLGGQRHRPRRAGPTRRVEVADLGVAHEVDAAAPGE